MKGRFIREYNEEISKQIMHDEVLKGLNLQGEQVAQSLCKLLNILARTRTPGRMCVVLHLASHRD